MTVIKPVYLLAGGRASPRKMPDPAVLAVFAETGVTAPVVAYVGAANGDDKRFFGWMSEIVLGTGAKRIDHAVIVTRNADLNKARKIIESADVIFISGGDVEAGMQGLEEKQMIGFLREQYQAGKVFFGTSAGSIMLAKEWVRWPDPDDDASAEMFPCLDFAPVICDTHDEDGGWEELHAALKLKGDKASGYGIPSGLGLKVYPDGKVEALSGAVPRFINRGGKVQKEKDILPDGK